MQTLLAVKAGQQQPHVQRDHGASGQSQSATQHLRGVAQLFQLLQRHRSGEVQPVVLPKQQALLGVFEGLLRLLQSGAQQFRGQAGQIGLAFRGQLGNEP